MTPPSPAANLLENAASIIDWSEFEAPPATFGLAIVPKPEAPQAPRVSLRRHIEGVEAIADTIEGLDDETLSAEERDELSAMLIGAIAGTKRKVDNTSNVLAMYEALEAGAKAEKERLAKRESFYARQIERLTDYVIATMTASDILKLEGETSTFALRKNPPSVVIEAGATFAYEFMVYPEAPAPRPDKDAIKRALKAKREIAGASLQSTMRLVRS
jgi:Siphovirus Gp157